MSLPHVHHAEWLYCEEDMSQYPTYDRRRSEKFEVLKERTWTWHQVERSVIKFLDGQGAGEVRRGKSPPVMMVPLATWRTKCRCELQTTTSCLGWEKHFCRVQ